MRGQFDENKRVFCIMAEGKNKILVYKDWIDTFESLTDEEAGKLIKHFFRYINDLNPELEDRLLQVAFLPIKQTLKRDLAKWQTFVDKQKANGKKGGRPKTQKTQPFLEKPKKAVNDSVSVNDKVNVISILDRKYKFAHSISEIRNEFFKEVDLETVKEFCDYWTEHGERDKKMRFEKQKSFNKKLRFKRWLKNQKEWKKQTAPEKKQSAAQILRDKYKIN